MGSSQGIADQWPMGAQQAHLAAPDQDQVRSITLRAWAQIGKGPMQVPLSGITQAPGADLPTFTGWKRTYRERHHLGP